MNRNLEAKMIQENPRTIFIPTQLGPVTNDSMAADLGPNHYLHHHEGISGIQTSYIQQQVMELKRRVLMDHSINSCSKSAAPPHSYTVREMVLQQYFQAH